MAGSNYREAVALEDISRTLKEISSALKEQNRLLKNRLLKKRSSPTTKDRTTSDEPVEEPVVEETPKGPARKTYGWSMANSVQRDGGLNIGDIKIEKDDSHWSWTGETWERIELPSGQT